jgi:hypothetical protein
MNGGVGAAIVDDFEIEPGEGAKELFQAGSISKTIAALTALRLGLEPQVELPPSEELAYVESLGIEPPREMGLGIFLAGARFSHVGGAAGFSSVLIGSSDGSGAVVMARGPFPPVLELVARIGRERDWASWPVAV